MLRLALVAVPLLILLTPARADNVEVSPDAEGCKDHPLWTRMPNYHIESCDSSQFDLRPFPNGKPGAEDRVPFEQVEGPTWRYSYVPDEGTKPASNLQVMRNFQNAGKKAGAVVVVEYPSECTAYYDDTALPGMGNSCINYGTTLKLVRDGKEHWTFVNGASEQGYNLMISERAAMKQDIAVNEIVDELNKAGFIALYINFDTGKSTIKPDSNKTLDDAAAALKAAPDLKIEVGGHTDNVGGAEANQKLSEERAKAVMAALVTRGVPAARLTAKGFGQSAPVADNRSEDGRAKNRRVELTKK